jgi:hypothetical protein
MIEENPGYAKAAGKVRSQSFHAEGFGRVMAGVKDIDSQFFRQSVSPMRPFSGDERIHALSARPGEIGSGAAGHNSDPTADLWPARDHQNPGAGRGLQTTRQFGPGNVPLRFETDVLAMAEKEWLRLFETECRAELRVIAQARMGIERQMRAIHGQIILDQKRQYFAAFAGPGMGSAPEKTVVNNQQIGPGSDGKPGRRQAGINRGGNFRNPPAIFNLQSVDRAIVVFDFGGAQQVIAVADDFQQRDAQSMPWPK